MAEKSAHGKGNSKSRFRLPIMRTASTGFIGKRMSGSWQRAR